MGDIHHGGKLVDQIGDAVLASADLALSGGWGSTATATPSATSKDTKFRVSILCQGAGVAANPTAVLTFKQPMDNVPAAVVSRGEGAAPATGFWAITAITAAAVTLTFFGTPVAASTYIADVIVRAN